MEKFTRYTDFMDCAEEYRLNYRNKAELTFGFDHENIARLGFNRGNYGKGIALVESAHKCPIISKVKF